MSIYGMGEYGIAEYSSDIYILKGVSELYVGSEISNGYEANAIFDQIKVTLDDKSDADIVSIFNNTISEIWDIYTILMANFDSSLEGGHLFADDVNVYKWFIYKKRSTEIQYNLIAEILNDSSVKMNRFEDWEVSNYVDYDYIIEGIAIDGIVTRKYEQINNRLKFKGIWLIDTDQGKQFNFRYNLPEVTFASKKDRVEMTTFSKYPIIRRDIVDYKVGSLQCDIITNENNTNLIDQVRLLESFEGNKLILKTDNGEIFKVDIYDITYTRHPESDEISTIKCNYSQIGEVL